MDDYFIGIDIGTGSVKALAVNASGTVLSSAQVYYTMLNSPSGYCEQDPEVIFAAFVQCIHQLINERKSTPVGISLSAAMHSLILLDQHYIPITPVITWADNRAATIAGRMRYTDMGTQLYRTSGTPLHAMSPLFKIMWFAEQRPELFQQAKKFISIKEYIWYKLFNVFEVDFGIASACGLMDIEALAWNPVALQLASIHEHHLSTLVNTDHVRSDCREFHAKQMGIHPKTKIVIGGSDGCMANLGSFAITPGIGALTIGTSGAVRVASHKPVYNDDAMTFNYRLNNEVFICGGPTNNGGIIFKWYAETLLKRTLITETDYDLLLNNITAIPAGSDGLIFLPYLLGERAPHWNSNASGVFFGIRSFHTQEHFTRAVVEGITMALFNICHNLEDAGLSIQEIHVSGGFIKSRHWLKMMADVFGKKLCILNTNDASALGAAYLGMKKTGMIASYSGIESTTLTELFPDMEAHNHYQKVFQRFSELYQSVKGLMKPE